MSHLLVFHFGVILGELQPVGSSKIAWEALAQRLMSLKDETRECRTTQYILLQWSIWKPGSCCWVDWKMYMCIYLPWYTKIDEPISLRRTPQKIVLGGSEVQLQRPKYHPPSNHYMRGMRTQAVHLLKRQQLVAEPINSWLSKDSQR